VLALDVGNRRIGLAVSDPLRLFARPLRTLTRSADAVDHATLLGVVRDEAVEQVVVGLPLLPSGDRGEQAQAVAAFMNGLAPLLAEAGVAWSYWDESYTTLAATERRRTRGHRSAATDPGLDAEAAAVILEEWLRAGELAAGPPLWEDADG
jgi:putative Holliday junction resolvase